MMPHEHAALEPAVRVARSRAAALSVAFNLGSTILKFVGAALTHSVSLYSEAIHSAADVVASGIAFFSVKAAAVPADDEHPFGHGKIESLTSFAEAIFLLMTMAFIANEAIRRLIHGGEVQRLDTGIWIMAVSAAGSLFAGMYVSSHGRRTRSLALQSNGQHLLVDFGTCAGVLIALLVTRLTGWQHADPILALVLATWIGFNSIVLCGKAYQQLIDRRLPDDELDRLRKLLDGNTEILSYHRLRSRLSGAVRHIDVHVVVPNEWSVTEAHRVADDIEKTIRREMAPAEIVVHVDPFDATKST